MTKNEIEIKILNEFDIFYPTIKLLPFDVAKPILQKELWRLADKYDTDGANVFNIVMKRYGELQNGKHK